MFGIWENWCSNGTIKLAIEGYTNIARLPHVALPTGSRLAGKQSSECKTATNYYTCHLLICALHLWGILGKNQSKSGDLVPTIFPYLSFS